MGDKMEQKSGQSVWESVKPFVFGGMAGMMATSIIQPLDFFKVVLPHAPFLLVQEFVLENTV